LKNIFESDFFGIVESSTGWFIRVDECALINNAKNQIETAQLFFKKNKNRQFGTMPAGKAVA
jgi:hypothetical protein